MTFEKILSLPWRGIGVGALGLLLLVAVFWVSYNNGNAVAEADESAEIELAQKVEVELAGLPSGTTPAVDEDKLRIQELEAELALLKGAQAVAPSTDETTAEVAETVVTEAPKPVDQAKVAQLRAVIVEAAEDIKRNKNRLVKNQKTLEYRKNNKKSTVGINGKISENKANIAAYTVEATQACVALRELVGSADDGEYCSEYWQMADNAEAEAKLAEAEKPADGK